jgi:hypothetical protein
MLVQQLLELQIAYSVLEAQGMVWSRELATLAGVTVSRHVTV